MTRWQQLVLGTLVAVLTHMGVLWGLPRFIVAVARSRMSAGVGVNHVVHAPMADADWHTVVMPSPDLLYSACAFDVRHGPVRVDAIVPTGYFSVSGFAANTDNFFAVNDRSAQGSHLVLVLARDAHTPVPVGARVIVPPTDTGVVLFRQLVLDRGALEEARRIQHAAQCQPLTEGSHGQ